MGKRLLDVNRQTGEITWHHYDHATDTSYIEVKQNVRPYIERNKRLQRTEEYKTHGKKQEFMHIATIPNNVIIDLKNKHGIDVFNKDDLPKLERLLMSREFQYLRTVDRI